MRRPIIAALVSTLFLLCVSHAAHAGSNFWTTNGPGGFFVLALVVDPVTPTTIYAGTRSGGVFKSMDAGASWFAVNAGITNLEISALAIDPVHPDTLYAGVELPGAGAPATFGVFKTINGGASWALMGTGFTDPITTALAIDPTNPNTVYAGTFFALVLKSTDAGASWVRMSDGFVAVRPGFGGPSDVTGLVVDPANPSTLYAGLGSGGVFKSTNGGGSWVLTDTGLPQTSIKALAIDPAQPAVLYTAATDVFKSIDGGASWIPVNIGASDVRSLVINPAEHDVVYAATEFDGVFRTANGGAEWRSMNPGLTNLHMFSLAIDPVDASNIYAGTVGSGVFGFRLDATGVCGGNRACSCGELVTMSRTLARDPVTAEVCAGDGLVVADGVRLEFRGVVHGSGSGTGVRIAEGARDVVLSGAVISGFDTGIASDSFTTRTLISGVRVGDSTRDGIRIVGDDNTVTNSVARTSASDGIVIDGNTNRVLKSTCSANGGSGLVVVGNANVLQLNRCETNGGHGIAVEGSGNALVRNVSDRNGGGGVEAIGPDNSFTHNQGFLNLGNGVHGSGTSLESDGHNYGDKNGGVNCEIEGFPTVAGRYC